MPVIRQIPRARWLASLVQSMSSRFNERPHLKQGEVFKKRVLLLMSSFQMHAWPGHIRTRTHTGTHAHNSRCLLLPKDINVSHQ